MVSPGLPVKRMVLYKHGVGFIERSGGTAGKDSLKLGFKREEMDDVLKSLSVFAAGKGQVTGVSYETADDISQLLAEKAIQVPDREALVGLLRALKGYRAKLWVPGEAAEGKVVGTEEETSSTPDGAVLGRKCHVVLQGDDERIRSFEVGAVSALQVLDPEARDDLKFYLDAVTSERKKNMKAVTIFVEGESPELSVSYITQMPSWRVSYRLAHFKDRTLLQGWGIIDNRLDEDLKDVSLSLVAGKPISFIYDIYTPRTVQRPVVREEVRTVSAPVELEAGMEALEEQEAQLAEERMADMEAADMGGGGGRAKRALMPARSQAFMSMAAPSSAPAPPEAMMGSTRVQTRSVEMGEFFRYDIERPVTVKRGQSAMVPILQSEMKCRKEHVYNASKMPRNPVVTMRLQNDTGLVLERGPLVVLDDGTYVGEAILPYTTAGGENHIAYSVDLGVVVTEKTESETHLKAVHVKDRYLQREHLEVLKTEYAIENKKADGILLVIEHPRRDHELADTPEPTERTESNLRWALEVKPRSQTKFKVKEVKTVYYSEQVRSLGSATLKSYLDAKLMSKTSADKIMEIIELQKRMVSLQKEAGKLAEETSAIVAEQGRLRQNLGSLGASAQEANLKAKYVSKLENQEKRLEEIARTAEKLQQEMLATERTIEAKLGALA